MRLLSASLLTITVLFSGCQKSKSESAPPQQTNPEDPLAESTSKAKEEFVLKLWGQMEQADEQMKDLKAKGKDLEGEAKLKWDQRIKRLTEKRDDLREKLDLMKSSQGDEWQELQNTASESWKNLHDDLKAAAEEEDLSS